MRNRMGKAAALVCVIILGTLLLATADTGDGYSSVNANENESPDGDSTTTLTSASVGFTQRTITQENDKTENNSEENAETNGDDTIESGGTELSDGARNEDEPSGLVCGSPPEIEGAVIPRTQGTRHRVGTTVTYSCHFGYVSRNSINHISTCRINEATGKTEWTTPEITCIPRSCGDPGYLNNGRRIGNLFTFPNKVEYECEEGYNLRGLRTRYCQAGGDWSGKLPMCELIYCSVPPDPANGRVKYSSLEYGTELIYECNAGYLLKDHSPRFCSEDGSWSNVEPECTEARCEEPLAPEHGSVRLHSDLKVGSLATYSCNPGKEMHGVATTKCLITGKWTFDAPRCLSPCVVPFIENGDFGRFHIKNTRWSSQEEFRKIYQGNNVKSFETVFVRCASGFVLMEDSKPVGYDRIEVTCSDGLWSKILQCQTNKKPSCNGAPPAIKNGVAVIPQRNHGYSIWYSCTVSPVHKIPGNVTCHYGQWIGVPPECLINPCRLSNLNYRGLVKPSKEFIGSGESIDVVCENGFRRATWPRSIECDSGRWNIAQNPCTKERETGAISTTPMANTSPGSEVPQNENGASTNPEITNVQDNRVCSCTYDNADTEIEAQMGHEPLKQGDKIPQGATVTLECKIRYKSFQWRNGLRSNGIANMTCRDCKIWTREDLPTCKEPSVDDVIISYQIDLKISPGGIIDLQKGERRQFYCFNKERQPDWNYGQKEKVVVTPSYTHRPDGTVDHFTYLEIMEAEDLHTSRYECYTRDTYGNTISRSNLDLRVNGITCPWFNLSNGLNVSYSKDNKADSWATFTCPPHVNLVGNRDSGCQSNGKWTSPAPYCNYVSCPRFADYPELIVRYSNNVSVNSIATFRCSSSATNLVGESVSICQENGTWSNPLPLCEATDIRCPPINGAGVVSIHYSNNRRVNSNANFRCLDNNKRLDGCSSATCLSNGTWTLCYPTCVAKDILCPLINGAGVFSIYYNNNRKVNSVANIMCVDNSKRVDGCSMMTCLPNGTWTPCYPTCVGYASAGCPRFHDSVYLRVHYSKGTSVGSVATFSCSPANKVLVGDSRSVCQINWKWSHPPASCEDSSCSLGDLVTSEDVEPDMTDINGEFIPYGSEVKLKCKGSAIINGNSVALCKENGRWELGNNECVMACVLNIEPSSQLLAQPVKESYRFGEFVLLSCPPGKKMSVAVERLMCMGDSWSDSLPNCIE